MPSPFESALLNLKLFDLRREGVLREARAWFLREFNPESYGEVVQIVSGERNASFRMVLGYWDMAASLVTAGAIEPDAFRAAHGEAFATFSKVHPFLAEIRKDSGEAEFCKHLEAVVLGAPDAEAILTRRREAARAAAGARRVVAIPDQASEPAIVAPVSRFLGVRDPERAGAFYRDVLGFEVHQAGDDPRALEVVSGQARIRLGRHDYGPGEWDEPRPPGSAIVFLQTDDLEGLHEAIGSRGAAPSQLEKVNAIKMRVFEVRDPDGHTLWFGQSFEDPDTPALPGLLEKIMPGLPLSDVASGVAHYRDVLGFRVNYEQADLAVMDRDAVRLLLIARTDRHGGIGSAYVYVRDADALYKELAAKGANLQGVPISQPWGLREFHVLDPEGNQITFGQPFE